MFDGLTYEAARAHQDRYQKEAEHARLVKSLRRPTRPLSAKLVPAIAIISTVILLWQGFMI